MTASVSNTPANAWPALVLNADYRPLSYYPLSIWPWQDVVKAVFLERVDVVAQYDHVVRSPSFQMQLPSVICLREFIKQDRSPAFTRFNVFLRDGFSCVYCGSGDDLTFDHLIPRSRGGTTCWNNIVTACSPCNLKRPIACQMTLACTRTENQNAPPTTSYRIRGGASRRTICMRPGWTISTGMWS